MRAQWGLRAAVNAQLEEISFRTGLIAGAITLVALLAIVAAGVYATTLSHGGTASSTASVQSVDSAPATHPAAPASAAPVLPSASAHSSVSAKPKAQPTAPAAGIPPRSAAAQQPQTQTQTSNAGSASGQVGSQDYGHSGQHGYDPRFGSHAPRHGSFGFPGLFGRGPWH